MAVDPIDGTTLASKNLDNALSIIDGAERGQHVIVRRNSDASDRPHTGIVEVTREMLEQCHAGQLGCEADGVVFVESFPAAARLIVSGATDFARALVAVGRLLDFRTTVCDARAVFATAARFPEADDVVVDLPHRYLASTTIDQRTALCVLTHDPKFDVSLLEEALAGPAGYIGALGNRRTHEDRLRRLRAAGVRNNELERLRSPIGLDLGAGTPQETAVSILAEIIRARNGATGRSLTSTAGAIHR